MFWTVADWLSSSSVAQDCNWAVRSGEWSEFWWRRRRNEIFSLFFFSYFGLFLILQQHSYLVSDVFSCEIRKKNLVTETHLRWLLLQGVNRAWRTLMWNILNILVVFMLPIALTKRKKTLNLAYTHRPFCNMKSVETFNWELNWGEKPEGKGWFKLKELSALVWPVHGGECINTWLVNASVQREKVTFSHRN